MGNGEGGGFLMNSLEASRGSRYCLRGVRMLRTERREMRGEDYRGRGGGAGRRLLASFLGMKDIISVMGGGRGGWDL